jgi:hypothetical protein
LLEHLKYSGIDPQNLTDLVNIAVSLRDTYGIMPLDAVAKRHPIPNAVPVSYAMDSITINKTANVVLDIPRPSDLTIIVDITLGGTLSRTEPMKPPHAVPQRGNYLRLVGLTAVRRAPSANTGAKIRW